MATNQSYHIETESIPVLPATQIDISPTPGLRAAHELAEALKATDWSQAESSLETLEAAVSEASALDLGRNAAVKIEEALLNGKTPYASDLDAVRYAIQQARRDAEPEPLPWVSDWTEEPPKMSWLVDDWIPAGRVGLLTGRGGYGKTTLALQIALALSGEGDSFPFGGSESFPTPAGGVACYISWEENADEVKRRIRRIVEDSAQKVKATDAFHFLNLAGRGPVWGVPEGENTANRAAMLPLGERILADAERNGASLLVIDPVAAAFGPSENDRSEVRSFLSRLDAWAQQTDCAVLIVAHPSRSAGRGGDTYTHAGSTDWENAARFVLNLEPVLEKDGKDALGKDKFKPTREAVLKLVKSNYGPRQELNLKLGDKFTWRANTKTKTEEGDDGIS